MSFQIDLKCDVCGEKFPVAFMFPTLEAYFEEAKKRGWIIFNNQYSCWIAICPTCKRNVVIEDDIEEDLKRQVNEIFKGTQDDNPSPR